jgi:hypothetical protein
MLQIKKQDYFLILVNQVRMGNEYQDLNKMYQQIIRVVTAKKNTFF